MFPGEVFGQSGEQIRDASELDLGSWVHEGHYNKGSGPLDN